LLADYEEDASKRRERLRIIADILKAAKRGITKTEIMYKAGLSFAQLTEYLSLLVKAELIESFKINKKIVYQTTTKGRRYLQSYEEMKHLLQRNTTLVST
jgi:predicted transcriptional regulator